MATLYKANGESMVINPDDGLKFQLDELQKLVHGYIEVVRLKNDKVMICNEDGKLYGLSVNRDASIIYGYGLVVGDVVVCNRKECKL